MRVPGIGTDLNSPALRNLPSVVLQTFRMLAVSFAVRRESICYPQNFFNRCASIKIQGFNFSVDEKGGPSARAPGNERNPSLVKSAIFAPKDEFLY